MPCPCQVDEFTSSTLNGDSSELRGEARAAEIAQQADSAAHEDGAFTTTLPDVIGGKGNPVDGKADWQSGYDPTSLLLGTISPAIGDTLCRELSEKIPQISTSGLLKMAGDEAGIAQARHQPECLWLCLEI
eukprot:scaffold194338_cov28-Tisochrysis_lutea.AAC.5